MQMEIGVMFDPIESKIIFHALRYFWNNKEPHFLDVHLSPRPYGSFGINLIRALGRCEKILPDSGIRLLDELLSIPAAQDTDINKKTERFEQVIQKLAEITAISTILTMDWPPGTSFVIEPEGNNCKRPDLLVETPEEIHLFEIKCPCVLLERGKRSAAEAEVVVRNRNFDEIKSSFDGKITLPRDNNLRTFLNSATEKFSGFKQENIRSKLLILFWDEDMYRAISPLFDIECGIFTENTWVIEENGIPNRFPQIDGVILLNRYDALAFGTVAPPSRHTPDPFVLSTSGELRNVWLPNSLDFMLDEKILRAFGAADRDYFKGHTKYQNVFMVTRRPDNASQETTKKDTDSRK